VSGLQRTDERFQTLIRQAHNADREAIGELLEQYRDHLRAVARRRLGSLLNQRMEVSDVVQQTLIEAHQNFRQIAGAEHCELQAWLRRILQCNIANAIRDHLYTKKRALKRERSIGVDSQGGDGRAETIAGKTVTPSIEASRIEQSLLLLDQLDQLPADQAAAVRMRYMECRSITEIANELERSKTAAAGLVKRGMEKLREKMNHRARDSS
jgi:RNA polymerase sigma-70 factor (ECF subfamily)